MPWPYRKGLDDRVGGVCVHEPGSSQANGNRIGERYRSRPSSFEEKSLTTSGYAKQIALLLAVAAIYVGARGSASPWPSLTPASTGLAPTGCIAAVLLFGYRVFRRFLQAPRCESGNWAAYRNRRRHSNRKHA